MSMEHEMTNEQLVSLIKAGDDVVGNMERLYLQMKGFICSSAWKLRGYAEMEDLEQEGYLALYPAVDGYDPTVGCSFLSYAGKWIRQVMIRHIQNNGTVRIPVHEQERIWQYRKLEKAFLSQVGRKPSEREIEYYLGLSRQQVQTLKKAMWIKRLQSLDESFTEDGETSLVDIVPGTEDVEERVLDAVEYCQLKAALWAEVDSLPGNQPQVIHSRYQKGQTLKQTGEAIGVTPERVRIIESEALRELRKPRHGRKLCSFLPEAAGSQIYRHGGVREFNRTWMSSTERAVMKLLR